MDERVILPGVREDFVELSRTKSGRLFKKNILRKGTLNYGGKKIPVDDELFTKLTTNFKNKVCDIVQVPVAGAGNEHTEDPFRNIGEVVDLKQEGDNLYAYFDARDEAAADKLGKTLLGASAMFSMDYTDTRTGQKAGPTLLHMAITNRPHVVDLEDFEEVIAASAEGNDREAVYLTATEDEEEPMSIDELFATLKVEHGIDVPALQAKVAEAEPALALSAKLSTVLSDTGLVKLSAGTTVSEDDVIGAIGTLAERNVTLSARLETVEADRKNEKAAATVDAKIAEGFILPAKRDAQIKLFLSNPESFEELLPEKPLVALSHEEGLHVDDDQQAAAVDAEILRLTSTTAAKQYIQA